MSDPTPQRKRKRGRETAGDMVRSLGVVMVLVLIVFWLAQPPDSDKAEIRVVDPAVDIRSFTAVVASAPVPGTLPAQWRPTVARFDAQPDRLRIGYNTPANQYAEYFASTGRAAEFLVEATGQGAASGTVDIAGVTWQQVRDADGSLSIYRTVGSLTVVLGSLRSTASLDELRVLAGSLVPVTPRG